MTVRYTGSEMVIIKVCHKSSGEAASGKRIVLGIDGLFTGGMTDTKWTDSAGEAEFDIKPSNGRIFVDGHSVYEGRLSGRKTVYI